MTSKSDKIKALFAQFGEAVAEIVAECEDPKAARQADKERRHAKHPREPFDSTMVKVYFDGDKDGNTFAVCHLTDGTLRPRRNGHLQGRERLWKYSYENATGTANKRTWIGMLKTLDGHGRKATKIEIYTRTGMRVVDLTA